MCQSTRTHIFPRRGSFFRAFSSSIQLLSHLLFSFTCRMRKDGVRYKNACQLLCAPIATIFRALNYVQLQPLIFPQHCHVLDLLAHSIFVWFAPLLPSSNVYPPASQLTEHSIPFQLVFHACCLFTALTNNATGHVRGSFLSPRNRCPLSHRLASPARIFVS